MHQHDQLPALICAIKHAAVILADQNAADRLAYLLSVLDAQPETLVAASPVLLDGVARWAPLRQTWPAALQRSANHVLAAILQVPKTAFQPSGDGETPAVPETSKQPANVRLFSAEPPLSAARPIYHARSVISDRLIKSEIERLDRQTDTLSAMTKLVNQVYLFCFVLFCLSSVFALLTPFPLSPSKTSTTSPKVGRVVGGRASGRGADKHIQGACAAHCSGSGGWYSAVAGGWHRRRQEPGGSDGRSSAGPAALSHQHVVPGDDSIAPFDNQV